MTKNARKLLKVPEVLHKGCCTENKELDMDDRGCYTYDKDGVHASTNTVNPTANGKKQTFIPMRRNYRYGTCNEGTKVVNIATLRNA